MTGPAKEASKGIFVIMDIFGFFDQTIQGCDILATADDHNKYAVFLPDAFDGAPLPIELFPPDNEDKQKKLGEFFGKNSPPSFVPKVHSVLKDAQAKYPNIKEWGVVGVSPDPQRPLPLGFIQPWGFLTRSHDSSAGAPRLSPLRPPSRTTRSRSPQSVIRPWLTPKMQRSTSRKPHCHVQTTFRSEKLTHNRIKIPLIMLASKDEPPEDVDKFGNALTGPKHIEIFKDQIHGWMAARSNLKDERVQEEYTRGYKTVLNFFAKNWS